VTVRSPVLVRSVNGPEVTIIRGQEGMRCVYVGADAVLRVHAETSPEFQGVSATLRRRIERRPEKGNLQKAQCLQRFNG